MRQSLAVAIKYIYRKQCLPKAVHNVEIRNREGGVLLLLHLKKKLYAITACEMKR